MLGSVLCGTWYGLDKVQLYSYLRKLLRFIAAVRRHVFSCDSSWQALLHALPGKGAALTGSARNSLMPNAVTI